MVIHDGQKVGLTGANGAGKSTLLALAAERLSADAGEVRRSGGQVIAEVAQDMEASDQVVAEYVLDGDAHLRYLQEELQQAEQHDHGERIGLLYAELESIDGFAAEARVGKILSGLGVSAADQHRRLHELSGGLRRRAALARALMCRSTLLLLDEPTNHLDMDAVIWLEGWLQRYPGTLVLVAHDRDFLDQVAGSIAHLENGQLQLYNGNYSAFETQRAEALSQQQALRSRQMRERAHMEKFVERFRYKASKARQAQSRLKALQRMPSIASAHADSQFSFKVPDPERLPNPLLDLEGVTAGYGDITILTAVQLRLQAGQRIGILGRNGAGKSTLVRLLAGELAPQSGRYQDSADLNIGYFAQHQLEQLRADEGAFRQMARQAPLLSEQQVRNILGGFGFPGDLAFTPVAHLSGGERARLALALVLQTKPNLLLLDEPTNHLDLEMRYALTLALQDYQGGLLVVSHDRHLLRNVVDELWLVADGRVEPYSDDLDAYVNWLKRTRREDKAPERQDVCVPKVQAEKRKLSYKERRELEQLPDHVERLEGEQYDLQKQLADPLHYKSHSAAVTSALSQRLQELEEELQQRYERWAELESL